MSEALNVLIRKRAGIKSNLTIFSTYVGKIAQEFSTESALTNLQILELRNRVARIQDLINSFEDTQTQIEVLDDNLDSQYSEREAFQIKFYENLSRAQEMLNECDIREKAESLENLSSVSQHSLQQLQSIKLPTIELPKFSGSYEGWLEFRDIFESLIHKNNTINEVQKFHYLRASVAGEAAEVMSSLEFVSGNYIVAWEILCNRYNNTRLLVHNHVKALFNLPTIKESSIQIRKLIDSVCKHLRALKALGQPTSEWDTLIIYIIATKLDSITAREWEQYKSEDVPNLECLKGFLKSRADLLETLELNHQEKRVFKREKTQEKYNTFLAKKLNCQYCQKDHQIRSCGDFLNLSIDDRIAYVRKSKLCTNCLKRGHFVKECHSSSCQRCKAKHNTLLHIERETKSPVKPEEALNLSSRNLEHNSSVLLATALVQIQDTNLKYHNARALLDTGSQSNFMTTRLCDKLNLRKSKIEMQVGGLNNSKSQVEYKCITKIQSRSTSYCKTVAFLTLPEITGILPNFRVDANSLKIPSNITLADPSYHEPSDVDILLGGDIFWDLICTGQIKLNTGPVLQKTKLGWVVTGPIIIPQAYIAQCNLGKDLSLQLSIERFWQVEECSNEKLLSDEEKACENHFVSTTYRDESGRFVVSIPLKQSIDNLGDSKETAIKRFYSLERKLLKNNSMREQYINFMREYESLGHMRKIDENENNSGKICYYMPHHGVFKEDSLTTKLRVVFDASAVTSSGYSFNNLQMVGPTIQEDLFSILLRFRKHIYVVSADIEKMYRQILINCKERSLQRILWRDSPEKPIETFELQTVTYGTASAPFLAIRSLVQLGLNCERESPDIFEVIMRDFYVDDLLTGRDSIEGTISVAQETSHILENAGFKLRKWISNSSTINKALTYESTSNADIRFGESEHTKTLGLLWSSQNDSLVYRINHEVSSKITKRSILSDISQIFDPLGLLSPSIIQAKLIMQQLWQVRVGWDESLPISLHTSWINFQRDLELLNDICINRSVKCKGCINLQLHGFSDSSEKAYGACIYVRSVDANGRVFVNLLCAKSKVAPLKTITIPRLELCGALLLARLVNKVKMALDTNIDRLTLWTDSTIVLSWLRTAPNTLQTFVGNRVSEIQRITNIESWRHVPSEHNPADCLSRGVNPKFLKDLTLWWNGPNWLHEDAAHWPTSDVLELNLPEIKKSVRTNVASCKPVYSDLFSTYSTLSKLQRVTAFCLRFKENCKGDKCGRNLSFLSLLELNRSLNCLVRISQKESFPEEFRALSDNESINSKSRLISLNPFLDKDNIMRVGGRLLNSEFNFQKKHPIILSAKHPLTKLLFVQEHKRFLHIGPQMLLAAIREKFWPILGRSLAKKVVHNCTLCFKAKPQDSNAIMGHLPANRVNPSPPFSSTGVDYAGPFLVKDRKGRGCKVTKAYIALFICFITRAIHVELVSDLSSEAFIASLRRFVSRRGIPSNIYSDNGKNFIGANSELQKLGQFLSQNSGKLSEKFHNEKINWHFIPAYSPHFGGLWEAGIKSMKFHLKRVAGNAILTFEELNTLIIQIEAILNSRPLSPISQDPNDLFPITPAHFLIGRTLITAPDEDFAHYPMSRLSRFQRIQQLIQTIWARWSKEFISEMQVRVKWKKPYPSLKLNTLVLVKEDHQPPLRWKLGRVIELHPGKDGVVRVASIRTCQGIIKRAYVKLCPLPFECDSEGDG